MLFSQLVKTNCEHKQTNINVSQLHLSSKNVIDLPEGIFVSEPLGERIKKARKKKGLTLKALGDLIGRTHASLSQIENNINTPEKATLIALTKELNDSFGLDWLDEYLISSDMKKEVIENTSLEEIFSLKFPEEKTQKTGNTRRTREELLRLRKLAEEQLERMYEMEE